MTHYSSISKAYMPETINVDSSMVIEYPVSELFKSIQPNIQHIVVLTIFTSTCPPCKAIAKNLLYLSDKYSKQNECYIVKQSASVFRNLYPNWNSDYPDYQVTVAPSFLIFVNGIISELVIGTSSDHFLYNGVLMRPTNNQLGIFHIENLLINKYNRTLITDDEHEMNQS